MFPLWQLLQVSALLCEGWPWLAAAVLSVHGLKGPSPIVWNLILCQWLHSLYTSGLPLQWSKRTKTCFLSILNYHPGLGFSGHQAVLFRPAGDAGQLAGSKRRSWNACADGARAEGSDAQLRYAALFAGAEIRRATRWSWDDLNTQLGWTRLCWTIHGDHEYFQGSISIEGSTRKEVPSFAANTWNSVDV